MHQIHSCVNDIKLISLAFIDLNRSECLIGRGGFRLQKREMLFIITINQVTDQQTDGLTLVQNM